MSSSILYRATNSTRYRHYFEIPEEQITAFIGPHGSGKTELARILLGVNPVQSGSLTFRGSPMGHFNTLRTQIQGIFPDPHSACSPFQSVEQQFCTGIRPDAFRETLASMGVPESALQQKPPELCPEALQRVFLARIQLLQPDVLIADDPCRSISPSDQGNILAILQNLRISQKLTIVVFTRDSALAHQIGDRFFLMSDGAVRTQENLHGND